MSFYIHKNIIINHHYRDDYIAYDQKNLFHKYQMLNYNDRNRLKKIAYNRVLVEKILPRAANIFQILQIPILSIF